MKHGKTEKIVGTPWFEDFVRTHFHTMDNKSIAQKAGVHVSSVRMQAYRLGLFRMRLDYWTEEQIFFLNENFQEIGDKELAILFNMLWQKNKPWTWKHMEKKRKYLGLKRTPDQLRKIKARNKERGCWKNVSTWVTRGEAPVGEVRIWHKSDEGRFKVIKTESGFVHYAHWLYEKEFGPMPKGFVVGFKDRDNMNVQRSNLEAITRAEHARRNSLLKYPESSREIKALQYQLNSKIKQLQNAQSTRSGRAPRSFV